MKNRLKELRKTRAWSQFDPARALKISRQAVNGFESGKFTPSVEMAFKIAQIFDVALEEIFFCASFERTISPHSTTSRLAGGS